MLKIAMGMQREYSLFYVFSFMSSLCFLSKSYREFLFLEVLVILAVFPVASPSESFFFEKAIAKVALFNHINMMLAAVEVGAASGWLHHILAVFQSFVVRVIESVNVDGKSFAMLRYGMGMRDETEVETGGVVGSHRSFVVCIPIVDESHPLYRILSLVESFENSEHICRYRLVYHHFAHDVSAIFIHMQASQISQFASCYGAILFIRLSLHQMENIIRNGGCGEEMLLSQFTDGLLADDFSGLLCLRWKAEKHGNKQAYY